MLAKELQKYRNIYPRLRYLLRAQRNSYLIFKNIIASVAVRNSGSTVVPNGYTVCNTSTVDGEMTLNLLFGTLPEDLNGNLYLCQCLGTPKAYMIGETNLVKINFSNGVATLKNRLLWNPVSIAKVALQKTKHRFDHFGVMLMSPGLGISSYAEGVYVLPDGRLGITGDVDRPWIADRENLRLHSPLGKRKEWMPMMDGKAGEVMGELFSGYSNSHAIYTDTKTNELFLVNYQLHQTEGSHPCKLMRWCGKKDIQAWFVVGENGKEICIKQSIHELVFTRDYIILADTAFVTGTEMISQWKNAPLPNPKTVVYVIDRRHLQENTTTVVAKKAEMGEACIHLIADYENPNDIITVYMLHTPATNTAEVIRNYDKDLRGRRFSKHLVGYGTLPVLDISGLGKHCLDMKASDPVKSSYIRDKRYCWGPYMYTYPGRQTRPFQEQDLFVMFKGFHAEMLPKRIFDAYKNVEGRKIPLNEMFSKENAAINSSIVRVKKNGFEIADAYTFPDKVFLYTISCLESSCAEKAGYVLAGVAHDIPNCRESSGHEYWLFDANHLSRGAICKLGHKSLNNSILFHTVYLTQKQEKELNQKQVHYRVSLEEDYPARELKKWGPVVHKVFETLIWPYFDEKESDEKTNAERLLHLFAQKRVKK